MDAFLTVRAISSPVGHLTVIASTQGLRAIVWEDEDPESYSGVRGTRFETAPSAILDETEGQLGEYFAGERRQFDIPLDPVGTDFQKSAWKVLSTIPFGCTISYGDQARALGDVRKARAVGGANGRNPIPIVVPCHRVIGSDGSLTGFALGMDVKKFLLDFEKRDSCA